LTGLVGTLKLALYLWRKTVLAATETSVRPLASAARIGIGFGLPLILSVMDATQMYAFIVASALLGEFIDRGEFYAEIEVMTPARQMGLDLEELVRGKHDPTDP